MFVLFFVITLGIAVAYFFQEDVRLERGVKRWNEKKENASKQLWLKWWVVIGVGNILWSILHL